MADQADRRQGSRFPLGVDIGLGLALVVFLAAGFVASRFARQGAAATQDANQSLLVLRHLSGLLIQVLEAESGQRGYLLTGDERYLAAWQGTSARIDDEVAELRALWKESPEARERLDEV